MSVGATVVIPPLSSSAAPSFYILLSFHYIMFSADTALDLWQIVMIDASFS